MTEVEAKVEAEVIMLRFRGGPLDGTTLQSGGSWPPPDRLDGSTEPFLVDEPGHYAKVRQSQLPEPMPGIARGAEYEWGPDEPLDPRE